MESVILIIILGVAVFTLVTSLIAMKLTLDAKIEMERTLKSAKMFERANKLKKQNKKRK